MKFPALLTAGKMALTKALGMVFGGKKMGRRKGEDSPAQREDSAPAFPMEAEEKAPATPQNPGAGLPFSQRQLNLLQDIGI